MTGHDTVGVGPHPFAVPIQPGDEVVIDGRVVTYVNTTPTALVRLTENGDRRSVGEAAFEDMLRDADEVTVRQN